jgi:glutaredoxin 2
MHIDALMPDLEELDRLIESPLAVNGKLSLDDIRVLPMYLPLSPIPSAAVSSRVWQSLAATSPALLTSKPL